MSVQVVPTWITAFIDLPADRHERGTALWERLTGYSRSPVRGADGEFATLVPPEGDAFLRVQRVGDGEPRVHLDLHVGDLGAASDRAIGLGAAFVRDQGDCLTLTSPGGFTFCLVSDPARVVPPASAGPDGSRSRVDQVCLDIPPSAYDAEFAFWEALTGWEPRPPRPDVEFARLTPPAGQPLNLLLQRLDEEEDQVRAHLDWCADDRDTEVARHLATGATVVERFARGWTVMTGAAGFTYCVTDRRPGVRPS